MPHPDVFAESRSLRFWSFGEIRTPTYNVSRPMFVPDFTTG
ncbi:hypothetical protein ADIS_3677 [Lunatimonas lonarensis]|uniref:Uncharacterized protein n=1 Tax=Lunatimonas lonarensis TaxID=1232681 RepID=R7ZNU2_9BACT|nr:hypothetical protein ADIS_3677 [Lunatimonas lonarensis]